MEQYKKSGIGGMMTCGNYLEPAYMERKLHVHGSLYDSYID